MPELEAKSEVKETDYVLLLLCSLGKSMKQAALWDNKRDFKYLKQFKKSTIKREEVCFIMDQKGVVSASDCETHIIL